ncbi:MAG TPA: contact-dependent growth inhibition system immunity protein, partial [Polyangiaceae bacterium]|nr:contact-dependent growth inhibition system immunity protein [Polyangiaceae bacterium]
RDERLGQFFGGYFHQDWDIEGATSWEDVIQQYAAQVPRPQVISIRDDLRDWLEEAAQQEIHNLPPSFGCDYDSSSEGLTGRQWVEHIVAAFDRLLCN